MISTTRTESTWISPADTAKKVRAVLKSLFPATTFRVRSDSGAGSSIRIHWIDGPDVRAVELATGHFCCSDFDGMTDSTTYREPVLVAGENGELTAVCYGVHFIFCNKEWTPEGIAPYLSRVCRMYGITAPRMNLRESSRFKGELIFSSLENQNQRIDGGEYLSDILHRAVADAERERGYAA